MTMLPLLSAWILGMLVVASLWPRRIVRSELGLILPLGAGVGLGVTSAIYYAASLTPWAGRVSGIFEGGVFCGLMFWTSRQWRLQTATVSADRATDTSPGGERATATERVGFWLLLAAGVIAAGTVGLRVWQSEPYGGWDAWAIWNMRARMLMRWEEAWPAFYAEPSLIWSHPDYPLLVPASVARGWTWLGEESARYSVAVSAAFMLATAGLLGAVLHRLAGFRAAAVGLFLYVATPSILVVAASQYADIPQGFFFLAVLTLFALARSEGRASGLYALMGLCMGLAAWTKNEGLLFAAVTGVMLVADAARRRAWVTLLPVAAGLLVGLLPVLAFKFFQAPSNELISGAGDLWGKFFSGERHEIIARAFWRDGLGFGGWQYSPVALMSVGIVWGLVRGKKDMVCRGGTVVAVSLLLTWAGYYAVYLISPYDLPWHLNTSLGRLYQQLWPAAIFLWCWWVLGDSAEAAHAGSSTKIPGRAARLPWTWLAPGMLAVALATGYGLSLQMKDQEFARLRLSRGEALTAVVGSGWFSLEESSRQRWFWTAGSGAFLLHHEVEGEQSAGTFGFSFGLRSLDRRMVKIMLGDELVWEGTSDLRLQRFEIKGVKLPQVSSELRFVSEAPGVLESASPDARRLAFAVYNFALTP
jgi:4-amino-4-deoxy-L-arabinose transferase-like glycosyltransferase